MNKHIFFWDYGFPLTSNIKILCPYPGFCRGGDFKAAFFVAYLLNTTFPILVTLSTLVYKM